MGGAAWWGGGGGVGGGGGGGGLLPDAADVVQRCEALGDQILMRRKMVVRQRLPVRQQMHAQAWIEERDFLHQPLRLQRVRGDDCQWRMLRGILRQRQCVGRAVQLRVARTGMF